MPAVALARANGALRKLFARRMAMSGDSGGANENHHPNDAGPWADAVDVALRAATKHALGPRADASFGPFRVEALLGRGGHAVVHRAVDTRIGRPVALKRPRSDRWSPAHLMRFEREARIATGLRHPAVCTVWEAGEHDGTAYLATELLPGPTLARCIAEHRRAGASGPVGLPGAAPDRDARIDAIVEMIAQVASGVEHVHQSGFVHGDVTPGNVAFAADGAPVLFDFGIATAIDDPLSVALDTFGTPGYTAPELLGRATVDPRQDVFALGALLAELTTGHAPSIGVVHDSRSPLGRVILRALHANPDRRPPSAAAFLAELAACRVNRRSASGTRVRTTRRLRSGSPRPAPCRGPS